MNATDALGGLIALIIIYFPIYFFSQSIIKPLPKIYYRRPNKLETILLLPFGLFYSLLSLRFLHWFSEMFLSENMSLQFCQSARNVTEFLLDKVPSMHNLSMILYPYPSQSIERDIIVYSLFLGSYWFFFIWLLPTYTGKIFGEAYINIEPWELIRTKWRNLRPLNELQKYYQEQDPNASDFKELMAFLEKLKKEVYWELFKSILTEFLNPIKIMALFLNQYSKLPIIRSIPILGTWNPIEAFIQITSSNKTPSFARDFTNKDYQRVLDITLQNGKMFSGTLHNYRIDEKDNIEYLELANTVRWRHHHYSDTEKFISSTKIKEIGYKKSYVSEKLVPGDTFLIPFKVIEEINITKIPRNKIFVMKGFRSAENATKKISALIISSGRYVYKKVSVYVISTEGNIDKEILSLLEKKFTFFYPLEVTVMEDEDLVNTILDDYLSNEQKRMFLEIIESDELVPNTSKAPILLPPPSSSEKN